MARISPMGELPDASDAYAAQAASVVKAANERLRESQQVTRQNTFRRSSAAPSPHRSSVVSVAGRLKPPGATSSHRSSVSGMTGISKPSIGSGLTLRKMPSSRRHSADSSLFYRMSSTRRSRHKIESTESEDFMHGFYTDHEIQAGSVGGSTRTASRRWSATSGGTLPRASRRKERKTLEQQTFEKYYQEAGLKWHDIHGD